MRFSTSSQRNSVSAEKGLRSDHACDMGVPQWGMGRCAENDHLPFSAEMSAVMLAANTLVLMPRTFR